MVYLITQFDIDDLDRKALHNHVEQISEKLMEEGCRLLLHSDQMEFSVFSMVDGIKDKIRAICEAFQKYSNEVAQTDFDFELFTRETVENSGNFSEELIEAIQRAEGRLI